MSVLTLIHKNTLFSSLFYLILVVHSNHSQQRINNTLGKFPQMQPSTHTRITTLTLTNVQDNTMLLEGKRCVVMGVANSRSIAWGIARRWALEGADVCVTCQNTRQLGIVNKLLAGEDQWRSRLRAEVCDVTCDEELGKVFSSTSGLGPLNAILHSVAYAPASAMKPENPEATASLLATTRHDFQVAHDVSAYSLIAVARAAAPYLDKESSSITAVTFAGSIWAVPNYNIMGPAKASLESCARGLALEMGDKGVRVNCISAPPVRTLASRGIKDFDKIATIAASRAPLRRQLPSIDDISGLATFLASDDASRITGQTVYVDSGLSAVAYQP